MLKGAQAFELGIADAIFERRGLPRAVAALGRGRAHAARSRSSAPEIDRGEAWDAAVARGRAIADAKVHGAAPAPYRALELIARAPRTATCDEGFAAEDEALADLIMGDELRAGIYAFDLVQKRAKRPAGAPDKVAGPAGHQGRRRRRRPDGHASSRCCSCAASRCRSC